MPLNLVLLICMEQNYWKELKGIHDTYLRCFLLLWKAFPILLYLTFVLDVYLLFLVQTVDGKGTQTIFITNISWSEALKLRESLKTIQHVKNFFPLLNKVWTQQPTHTHTHKQVSCDWFKRDFLFLLMCPRCSWTLRALGMLIGSASGTVSWSEPLITKSPGWPRQAFTVTPRNVSVCF